MLAPSTAYLLVVALACTLGGDIDPPAKKWKASPSYIRFLLEQSVIIEYNELEDELRERALSARACQSEDECSPDELVTWLHGVEGVGIPQACDINSTSIISDITEQHGPHAARLLPKLIPPFTMFLGFFPDTSILRLAHAVTRGTPIKWFKMIFGKPLHDRLTVTETLLEIIGKVAAKCEASAKFGYDDTSIGHVMHPRTWIHPEWERHFADSCCNAVWSEDHFAKFKQDYYFRYVLEHVTAGMGAVYFEHYRTVDPGLSDTFLLGVLANQSSVGQTDSTVEVQDHDDREANATFRIGATQLRYLSVLGEIRRLVGVGILNTGATIVEVGGGYGGQAEVMLTYHAYGIQSYTICDLLPTEMLQQKYLTAVLPSTQAQKVHRCMAPNTTVEDFDLFISNYAVNELSLDLRLDYVRGLMRHARYGYMIWGASDVNWIVDALGTVGRTNVAVHIEAPQTGATARNFVVTWGPSPHEEREGRRPWLQSERIVNLKRVGGCSGNISQPGQLGWCKSKGSEFLC